MNNETIYSINKDCIVSEPESEPSNVYQCSVCDELEEVDRIYYVRVKAETFTIDQIICKHCWPKHKKYIQEAEEIYEHLDPSDAPMYVEEY